MPVPILKIPIDDAAAQRYFAAFKKYQEEAKNQGDVWKDSNDTLGLMAATMAGVASEIAFQAEKTRELADEEKKRAEAQKKAAKEKADADKDEADRDKAAAARRKHAIDQVKEYARGLADAAVNLGKWAIIGEGAALAGGALGLWGLDKFVAGVGEERRLSQGLGVTMGQRQGMGLYLQRYFDVNSTLETVANAQATPASWGLFANMGINPQGKDPAALTAEVALAARRMFLADKGNLGLAQAQGLTQIFSPYDLRRLADTPEGELRHSLANAGANKGLSDEVGRKWQDFQITVERSGLVLKNALIDRLTTLEPVFKTLTEQVTQLALTVLTPVNLKAIGDGLEVFSKYIGSKQFQDDFSTFVTDVSAVAKKMADALVFLGIVPPNPGGNAPAGVQGAGIDGLPTGRPVSGLAFGGSVGTGLYSAMARNYLGSQLISKYGWDQAETAGILSNVGPESHFNPLMWQRGIDHNNPGAGYGIGQWNAVRRAEYTKLFGHLMQSVTDPMQALREQTEFLNWELTSPFLATDPHKRNPYKSAGDHLRKIHDRFGAGYEVSHEYERPKGGRATAVVRGVAATISVDVRLNPKPAPSTAKIANATAGG